MPTLPDPLVSSRPDYLSGMPCFHGTRVPVKGLFDHLSLGYPLDEFLRQFPSVSRDHAIAVLAEAGTRITSAARTARNTDGRPLARPAAEGPAMINPS